jgi:hypothetical protein
MSNVRQRRSRMHSLVSHRGSSKRSECCFARGTKAVPPRAVRPSAASARPKRFAASSVLCAEPALSGEEKACRSAIGGHTGFKNPMFGKALCMPGGVAASKQMQALRRSAKPNAGGRAATSFARGGGFGSFASGVTQRKMRAGSVPQSALPNPSINRTSPGKPGAAGYLKR